jgi:hypothetical protein
MGLCVSSGRLEFPHSNARCTVPPGLLHPLVTTYEREGDTNDDCLVRSRHFSPLREVAGSRPCRRSLVIFACALSRAHTNELSEREDLTPHPNDTDTMAEGQLQRRLSPHSVPLSPLSELISRRMTMPIHSEPTTVCMYYHQEPTRQLDKGQSLFGLATIELYLRIPSSLLRKYGLLLTYSPTNAMHSFRLYFNGRCNPDTVVPKPESSIGFPPRSQVIRFKVLFPPGP